MMKYKASILILVFMILFPLYAQSEQFFYEYREGYKYRILSVVSEDVYIDRMLSHHAEILNKIAVTVRSVQDDAAIHEALFQTSERSVGAASGRSFEWSMDYTSVFTRDKWGHYTIDSQYYMPVVRDVPMFPDKDVKEGERWAFEGEEVHDFRESFGIPDPYRIPFVAQYQYLGKQTYKGKEYPTFSVQYNIFEEPAPVKASIFPTRIMGSSDQIVYWDRVLGQSVAYKENFRMIFELSNGHIVEYRGTATAEVLEAEPMDREKVAGDISKEIQKMQIPDTSVRVVDEGVTISLENIQFQPDSAVPLPGEIEKLKKIGQILQQYPDRDIVVSGHTAMAGTEAGRKELSLERARMIADYLIQNGIRNPQQVIIRGYGAEKPLADNSTEEGRKKNRRVEITILEN